MIAYLIHTAAVAAQVLDIKPEALAAVTTASASELYTLDPKGGLLISN